MASTVKRLLIGRPLANSEADHQRISKTVGLAVFSSDAISSTAYATGEILIVLVGSAGMVSSGGQLTTNLLIPIAVLVVILLALVVNSYRETIHAYPDGGGAYVVARENLGETPSLVAGASLLVDYVLTVAVSIAAGVLAIYSAFPSLAPYKVELCLAFLALLTVGNLRGLKESGRVFSVPTYVYIVMLGAFIVWAGIQKARGTLPVFDATTEAAREQIREIQAEHGPAVGHRLVRHVHHANVTLVIKMGEVCHRPLSLSFSMKCSVLAVTVALMAFSVSFRASNTCSRISPATTSIITSAPTGRNLLYAIKTMKT